MKLGSLFSGGGLGDFGFMVAGMDIAYQVEIDEYCQKVLALRYPESKKYRDIKTLKGSELEPVDIITGGFPCQPFSVAGQQMGKSDDRHLWPQMFRIIQETKPRWVIGENVSGFVDMALDDVCANLESAGYEVGTLIFPAHALGALHRRERIWIVAHAELRGRIHGQAKIIPATGGVYAQCESIPSGKDMADTISPGLEGQPWNDQDGHESRRVAAEPDRSTGQSCVCRWREYWATEPNVGRVAHGVASRVHRLKCLGNGQVPACTYVIGRMIMDIELAPTQQAE